MKNQNVINFVTVIKSIVVWLWKAMSWIWRNPEKVLGGWLAIWTTLLAYVTTASGVSNALLLVTSGVTNVTSVTGLFTPVFASLILFAKEVIPLTWKFLEDSFYRIFRKVKKEFEAAYAKIKDLLNKIFQKMKELIQKVKDVFKKMSQIPKELIGNIKKSMGKLFGAEIQEVLQAEQSLRSDLDALDKLAPESTEYTDGIRNTSSQLVSTTLGTLQNSDQYLGNVEGESLVASVYNSVHSLGDEMLQQYEELSQNLASQPNFV